MVYRLSRGDITMAKALVVVGLVLGFSGLAFADEAVLNNPPQAVSLFKQVVDKLDPSYETVWDVYNGGFAQGLSGSLYDFSSNGIHLVSLRAGVSTGMAAYSGVSLDLPGITARLLPAAVRTVGATSPLDSIWSVVGKYARVGLVGGYSWDHDDPLVGVTFGAALTF